MKLAVICVECEKEFKLSLKWVLHALCEHAERATTFGGFLCPDCGRRASEE